MDREIKVTKCGELLSCESEDRISIEFSPIDLLNLKEIFQIRALDATDYNKQADERGMRELFMRGRVMWENMRKGKDK